MKTRCRRFLIIFLLILILPLQLIAASGQEVGILFEQGNQAYSKGDFDSAILSFEEITSQHGLSAPLLFNLANSYTQKGNIGQAVLNYKRAEILAPTDPDIEGNLEKIRKENGLFQKELTGLEKAIGFLTINEWSAVFLITLLGLSLFLLAAIRFSYKRTTHIAVFFFSAVLMTVSIAGTYLRYQTINPSVVITNDAKLLISPFESATSTGSIQEGRLVYPQNHHGNYTLVQDGTGRKGWLAASKIEAVRK